MRLIDTVEHIRKKRQTRMDASARLAFGLCKKYGIDLPKGASPREAWEALKEKTGKTEGDLIGEHAKGSEMYHEISVYGPRASRKFIDSYFKKHPEVKEDAKNFMDVMDKVKNFQADNPDAEDGTYSATTGKRIPDDELTGYCVTFHQNLSEDDPYGGYDAKTYAEMCAITKHALGAKDVYIGYFGNPEVSFSCDDLKTAMGFAVDHNQNSIWDSKKARTCFNPYYKKEANPIKDH